MSAPSGYTALDFVGFTDKGTYSPIVKYMRNDLVHHGGNIMRCKVDDTLNVTPVEGANWEIWVGASANLVERVIAPLENNPADVAFGVGRQIIYDDWLWEVIAPIAVGDALIDYAVDPTNANIKKSAPVETQLLAVKAEADATDNMIAPTEANASSSSAPYSVGDQLILNNILYDVIAAIQIGDALTTGTGGNIKAADTLTEQLAAKANSSDLGTAAAKNSTNAVTSGSTALVESGAVYSEVDSVKQALTKVEPYIFKERGIIFISDSFGTYEVNNKNMMELAAQYLGITNYYQTAVNGASFVATANTFDSILASIPVPTWEVSDVVVLGGTNDHNISSSDILSAMGTFVTNAKTKFPNAKIWMGCTGGPSYSTGGVNGRNQTINNIYPAYLNCIKIGAYPLDNLISALHGNIYKRSDNTHPTDDGVLLLAKSIAECLASGRCHNNYLIINDNTNTTAENGGTNTAVNIFQSLNDENVTMMATGLTTINYATPVNVPGSQNFHLFTFDKFIGAPNMIPHISTQINFVSNGVANLQYADLFFDDNRLLLKTFLGGVNNVSQIKFTLPTFVIPTARC